MHCRHTYVSAQAHWYSVTWLIWHRHQRLVKLKWKIVKQRLLYSWDTNSRQILHATSDPKLIVTRAELNFTPFHFCWMQCALCTSFVSFTKPNLLEIKAKERKTRTKPREKKNYFNSVAVAENTWMSETFVRSDALKQPKKNEERNTTKK